MFLDISKFIQCLLNGLSTGSIYALVALGYTMVYGIIKLINFAHGDFIMVGCFASLAITNLLLNAGCNVVVTVLVAMIVSILVVAFLGFATEKIAYKPLRKSKRITALITAIAVSFLLENIYLKIYGSQNQISTLNQKLDLGSFNIGSVVVDNSIFITLGLLIVCTVLLTLWVNKSKTGKAMQAVSENPSAAALMGVNVDRTISITFIIGAAIAGLTSVIYCIYYTSFNPMVGSMLGIKAFVAAVLGGIGLIPGAVLGGLLIGLIEAFVGGFWSTEYLDAITFAILIIVLIVKPSGILGKTKKEKV